MYVCMYVCTLYVCVYVVQYSLPEYINKSTLHRDLEIISANKTVKMKASVCIFLVHMQLTFHSWYVPAGSVW